MGEGCSVPLSLVHRAGVDTLGKLERAAVKRFREARRLQEAGEALGAVYLYGYSAEITLKVAYYRIIGLVPTTPIDQRLHRRPAENRISAMTPLASGPPGHNISGWAKLVEQTRPVRWPTAFAVVYYHRVDDLVACWAEFLRYRANEPFQEELRAVRQAAWWFRRNSGTLWR